MSQLPTPLASPAITALNHLLAQEPWAQRMLAPAAGRVIRFDAAAFTLGLRVTDEGLVEVAAADAEPSVTLSVPLQQWPLVAGDISSGGQAAAMKHVRIEGDAELANTVSTLARSLRWDAAEDLARALRGVLGGVAGDSLAQRLVDGARRAHAHADGVRRAMVENVTEYLLDERPLLVRHAALDTLGAEVAALRNDLARLEKRLEKLEPGSGSGMGPRALPSAHR